jgi:hypothetical protein
MIIAHADTAPIEGASPHRSGGIQFRYLLSGDDNAKDNFALMLVEVLDGFETPRHRHNFEQIRIMLDGNFEYAPGKALVPGQIGYFSEGTYYTQKGVGRSTTLLLQVGGASGEGYMSNARMRQGARELQNTGEFSNGIYIWEDDIGKHNLDGYEAIWQHVNKRKISYPSPRYDGPVIMNQDSFSLIPVPGQPGCFVRQFGVFNERGLEIKEMTIAVGATGIFEKVIRPYIFYVKSGGGTANDEPFRTGSAIKIERGESLKLSAEMASRCFIIGLPAFDQ